TPVGRMKVFARLPTRSAPGWPSAMVSEPAESVISPAGHAGGVACARAVPSSMTTVAPTTIEGCIRQHLRRLVPRGKDFLTMLEPLDWSAEPKSPAATARGRRGRSLFAVATRLGVGGATTAATMLRHAVGRR